VKLKLPAVSLRLQPKNIFKPPRSNHPEPHTMVAYDYSPNQVTERRAVVLFNHADFRKKLFLPGSATRWGIPGFPTLPTRSTSSLNFSGFTA
jgi:hypothetical protein